MSKEMPPLERVVPSNQLLEFYYKQNSKLIDFFRVFIASNDLAEGFPSGRIGLRPLTFLPTPTGRALIH